MPSISVCNISRTELHSAPLIKNKQQNLLSPETRRTFPQTVLTLLAIIFLSLSLRVRNVTQKSSTILYRCACERRETQKTRAIGSSSRKREESTPHVFLSRRLLKIKTATICFRILIYASYI